MLLTFNALDRLIRDESLVGYRDGLLLPFPAEQINGASVDLTLGDRVLVEERPEVVDLAAKETPPMREMPMREGAWHLRPGDFVLAHTREYFRLPSDVAGHYMLKSSLARAGLQHLFAGYMDPSWHGVLTLELVNATRDQVLLLRPGMKIGQAVFWRGDPVPDHASYAVRGQYNGDTTAQPSRGVR